MIVNPSARQKQQANELEKELLDSTRTALQPYLSKSRFMSGMQCSLRLWYEVFDRELLPDPDPTTQFRFDTGTEVGELAQKRYRGGRLIGHDHEHFPDAYRDTQEVLADTSIIALFELAFQYRRVRCRVDILQRLSGGGWRIIEVKSATKVKEEYIDDVALQYWVLKGCNIDVRDACVLTLNSDYVRGKKLNVQALFNEHSVWEEVQERVQTIGGDVAYMKQMLSESSRPDIAMGNHCTTPYKCPFYEHCSSKLPELDHPVTEFYRMYKTQVQEIIDLGIMEIKDVPEDFDLSEINREIRKSVVRDRAQKRNRDELVDRMKVLKTPVHHLDFETFNPAIPQFEGTSPYQIIPFMFSVHTESRNGLLNHTDYLHEESTDPRRSVAEQLIDSVGERGSICTYTPFEKTQISNLAKEFPDLEESLKRISNRLVDLHPFVRDHFYHPDFRGSFSLKSVYPVLGESDYSDLEIDEGGLASVVYMKALRTDDSDERNQFFRDLREYCERDTLATHEILKSLREHVGSS